MYVHQFNTEDPNKPYTAMYLLAPGEPLPSDTTDSLPIFKDGYWPCFIDGEWTLIEDYRGKVVYIGDKEIMIEDLGKLPDGARLQKVVPNDNPEELDTIDVND